MWWQTGVIYQIYPRSFMDSNNDGVGDLPGVIQRLDHLDWLGVDAIWFSPIFPSPQADFGYDVADYTGIHHEYGTLADFDHLLEEAHKRSIKILLDLVPNHTSNQHPWFIESRASRDNPKRDWYIWRDPAPDGGVPNNWVSYFGGPAWTFDEQTGQYYMHNFDTGQPELNWRNPEVEQAMFDSIRFWLKRGVDGFRIDVIDRILKDEAFRDNPPNPDWQEGNYVSHPLLRVHSEQAPGTHEYMRRFRAVFDEFPGTVAVGEVDYGLPVEKLVSYYGDDDELHLPFNFGLIWRSWDAATMREYIDAYDAAVPEDGWPNYVLGNHDVPRLASRVGAKQARVAAMMLLTLRGTPTIYYGEEIGMENTYIPPEQMIDPQGKGGGLNRDEVRTPMQWDASPNAGFTGEGVETWLPLAPDYARVNVAAQRDAPDSMLSLYRRLLAYRRQTPALQTGAYESLDAPEGCFAYTRSTTGQKLAVVLNFTSQAKTVNLSGIIKVSTHTDCEGERVTTLSLRGDEGVIIELL